MPVGTGPRYATRYGWDDGDNNWGDSDASGGVNRNREIYEMTLWASVIAFSINAPPGGPADGDCYVVGNAGSGAWAGHNFNFAYWSGAYSEWRFLVPLDGARVWDQELERMMVYSGEWGPMERPIAVIDVVTAPAGSPLAGDAYLVGPSLPTGAFSGHPDNIAFWTGGNWKLFAPDPGRRLWNMTAVAYTSYDGSAWV